MCRGVRGKQQVSWDGKKNKANKKRDTAFVRVNLPLLGHGKRVLGWGYLGL